MPLMTVGTGAPEIEPGTYPVTIVGVEAKVVPYNGEDNDVFEWKATIDGTDKDDQGNALDPIEVSGLTSQMTGPKSKTAAFLTALLGPEALEPGKGFDEADLVGKQALAQIELNAKGWPKIAMLVPKPREARRAAPAPAAAPAAASVAATPAPAARTVRAQAAPAVAEGEEDLPF